MKEGYVVKNDSHEVEMNEMVNHPEELMAYYENCETGGISSSAKYIIHADDPITLVWTIYENNRYIARTLAETILEENASIDKHLREGFDRILAQFEIDNNIEKEEYAAQYDGIVYRDENGKIVAYRPRIQGWFGEKYEPLYPELDFEGMGIATSWSDDPDYIENYYDTRCSTEFLIEEANFAEWLEDTMFIVRALYKRDPKKAIELTEAIIEHKKGDEYLQQEAQEYLDSFKK